jgi:hypothetical protein
LLIGIEENFFNSARAFLPFAFAFGCVTSRHSTPTLIGCNFLMTESTALPLIDFTAISEAFDYSTFFSCPSNNFDLFDTAVFAPSSFSRRCCFQQSLQLWHTFWRVVKKF